jgi:hypothetical protein
LASTVAQRALGFKGATGNHHHLWRQSRGNSVGPKPTVSCPNEIYRYSVPLRKGGAGKRGGGCAIHPDGASDSGWTDKGTAKGCICEVSKGIGTGALAKLTDGSLIEVPRGSVGCRSHG